MPRRIASRKSVSAILSCLSFALVVATLAYASDPIKKPATVLEHQVKTIDGEEISLKKYKGDVLLIVNTASQCDYTSQYETLEALHQKFKVKGFQVLAFPSNDFGRQEPGTEAEIKAFCQFQYHVTFPLFAKTIVKGEGIHPLYVYLTAKETNPKFGGEVTWNFAKFLVNRKGEVIARFEPGEMPDSEVLFKEVEAALAVEK